MISVAELLTVTALAVALAQCVAWLVQMVSSRGLVNQGAEFDLKGSDESVARSFWGETTRAHFHYVRRRTRYQVHCPVLYEIDGESGNGVVVDMSREGWRIRGSGPVPPGTVMCLKVTLPGLAAPVPIFQAAVRWSEGKEFGISLIALDPEPAILLSEYFSTLTPVPQADLSAA